MNKTDQMSSRNRTSEKTNEDTEITKGSYMVEKQNSSEVRHWFLCLFFPIKMKSKTYVWMLIITDLFLNLINLFFFLIISFLFKVNLFLKIRAGVG